MKHLASLILLVAVSLFSAAAGEASAPTTAPTPRLTTASPRSPFKHIRFHDLYECYIITDVEVASTEEEEEDYEYVDRDDFMSIICRARKSYVAFEPAYVCNLYDDEGIRYTLYISHNCTYFRIDSNYFRLSNRQARALKQMLP